MSKFIVHIGDRKCGSSAIQASLFDARSRLKKQGVSYCSSGRAEGNYNFITLAGISTRADEKKQRDNANKVVAELKRELDSTQYTVVSSEGFFSLEPEKVVDVLQQISEDVESIDVVIYVRDPRQMYLSTVQQIIKANSRFTAPSEYTRPIHKIVEMWESCPLISTTTVRLFDRSKLIANNVVADFESLLRRLTGLDAIKLEAVEENASLSAEQMIALQDFRLQFYPTIDGEFNPETLRLVEFFQRMNNGGLIGSKPQLGVEASRWIVHQNNSIFEWLAARFGLEFATAPAIGGELSEQQDWTKVATILRKVEHQTVRHLKTLIPAFNLAIAKDNFDKVNKSIEFLTEGNSKKFAYIDLVARDYWHKEFRGYWQENNKAVSR